MFFLLTLVVVAGGWPYCWFWVVFIRKLRAKKYSKNMEVVDNTVEVFMSLNLDSIPDGVQFSFIIIYFHLKWKLTIHRRGAWSGSGCLRNLSKATQYPQQGTHDLAPRLLPCTARCPIYQAVTLFPVLDSSSLQLSWSVVFTSRSVLLSVRRGQKTYLCMLFFIPTPVMLARNANVLRRLVICELWTAK